MHKAVKNENLLILKYNCPMKVIKLNKKVIYKYKVLNKYFYNQAQNHKQRKIKIFLLKIK